MSHPEGGMMRERSSVMQLGLRMSALRSPVMQFLSVTLVLFDVEADQPVAQGEAGMTARETCPARSAFACPIAATRRSNDNSGVEGMGVPASGPKPPWQPSSSIEAKREDGGS